jgi:pyruvate dehydrogenase (quinone)
VDYAGWAELLGFKGIRLRTEDEVGPGLDAAFAHQGVTVVDAYVSKNVPPLPAHVTLEYARNTVTALLKADPEERAVIADTAKAVIADGTARVKDKLHLGRGDDDVELEDHPK